jgi:hypothetical protein
VITAAKHIGFAMPGTVFVPGAVQQGLQAVRQLLGLLTATPLDQKRLTVKDTALVSVALHA